MAAALGTDSPLATVISVYVEALAQDGASPNTVSAFDADLRLFAESVGAEVPIGDIGVEHAERFREFLTAERDVPCSAATLRRRLTAVQSLFRFLEQEQVVSANPVETPSTGLAGRRHASADPLSESEVEALRDAAQAEAAKGDWRPLLLISLLLSTGMSKAECLALNAQDVDPLAGTVIVGQPPRSRCLPLSEDACEAYRAYRVSHPADGRLFDCTGRNLEYVLTATGRRAGLTRNPSFRLLRATVAAGLLRDGEPAQDVANHLGISAHTWPAMRRRLKRRRGATG